MKKTLKNWLGFLSLTLLLTIVYSCANDDADYPPFSPTVSFNFEIDSSSPLTVHFTSKTTNAMEVNWDFGDGNTSSEANPTHSYASDGEYTVVLTINGEPGTTPAAQTKSVIVKEGVVVELDGKIIGHEGSWDGVNGLVNAAFDGDLSTFVDAPMGTGGFVGYDFGIGSSITLSSVKYAPRDGWAWRLVNGEIRGSNDPTFSNYTVLYTIAQEPATGTLTEAQISGNEGFRFIYFQSPVDGYCNIAELEFYGEVDFGVVNMNNWTVQQVSPGVTTTLTDNTINFNGTGGWSGSHIFQQVNVEAGTYQLSGLVKVNSVIDETWSELIFSTVEPQEGQDYVPGIPYQVVYSTWNGSPKVPAMYDLGEVNAGGEYPADGVYTFNAPESFYIVIKSGSNQPYNLTWNNISLRKIN
ncbi:PKD domain-containing protein [Aegicerativicinus sediminis]|uniref:PKD domain-containing protein n=1 Tax=Aegicerativicinus sediminis TaxID=2893202 RepID=UPI0021CE6B0E|nr:PKD domain-containing protein [Aegicerativicinus sediminis]